MPTLGLIGDVMLGRKVNERHRNRPVTAVWGNVLDGLRALDGLLVNLECCLSTRGEPWTRTYRPFHFRADPGWARPALETATVDVANLANNHMLDFGHPALTDTLDELDKADITHVGAGRTRAAARKPGHCRLGGLDVAVVGFTDNTPEYAATEESPGVSHVSMAPDDREDWAIVEGVLDRAIEREPNLLVASLHWGPNMEAVPDERYRRFGRALIEYGVDLVHGHSAHVFQGIERHDGGLILYDTGDFVDDYVVDNDLRNDRSFLFELTVSSGGSLEELRLRPVEIGDMAVNWADTNAACWCQETMRDRTAPFGTAEALKTEDTDMVLTL